VIDFIHKWGTERTGLSNLQIVAWVGIARSKFYDWRARYGKANEHNAWIPRDHWIEDSERDEIVKFAREFPLEGYRRLTFMMLDRDVVAVSPSTTYRVLKAAGLIQTWNPKPSKKGTGFVQPLAPHEHWHVDVSYINVAGTFYYLCSLLDGCSRSIVHHELRESMTEADIEIIIQRALKKFPGQKPRIICCLRLPAPSPFGLPSGCLRAAFGRLSLDLPAPRFRQRPAVHCKGLQRVRSHCRSHPRQNLALLPTVQRQNRALAQVPQERLHPPGNPSQRRTSTSPHRQLR